MYVCMSEKINYRENVLFIYYYAGLKAFGVFVKRSSEKCLLRCFMQKFFSNENNSY